MKGIHNWIAIVAILAVTLLGAVALGRAASERDHTLRNAVLAMCERQNVGRYQIDVEFARLNRAEKALSTSLLIAQGDKDQSRADAIRYASIRASLQRGQEPVQLPLVNCDQEVPSP